MQSLSGWASGGYYEPSAVTEFLQDADYYLIAHAKVHGHIVVTHEVPSATKKKIKIPEACISAGVKYITPFEMLRREGARFVLEQRGGESQG